MCLRIVAGLDALGFIQCWFFTMMNNCVTSKSIGMATKQKQAETAELIIESDSYEHFSEDEDILQGDSDSDKDNVIDTNNT
jgi:hypothetical protein